MKKIKILTLLLISIFLVSFTKNVNAATGTGLFVNGEEFTSEKTTITCGSGTATYSASLKTLTLNNATITNPYTDEDGMTEGIYYDNEDLLKIELKGTNNMSSNYNAAIATAGDLSITGTGSLNINSTKTSGNDIQIGIISNGNLDTNGSTINIAFISQSSNDDSTVGLYAASGITIDNRTNLNINADLGILAMNEQQEEQDVTIYKGNIIISSLEAITGNLKLDDYEGKIMAGFEKDGINADVVTKDELIALHNYYYGLSYLKFGDFETYKVTNNSTPNNLLATPTQAFEGQKLRVEGGHDDYNGNEIYKLNSIQILNDNGDDITSSLLDSETNELIMPNYNITIKATFTKNFKVVPKTFTAKLYGYDDISFSWTSTKASHYQIYYKKGTATKYTSLGTTSKLTYKKANFTPGTKYTFKIVPYAIINGNKVYSDTYKTVTIYTLKKLNTPTVTKYNNSKVTVKWTKINGATGYQIARSKYKTKNFTTIKTLGSSYSKSTVAAKKGTTYYYKVRAYKTVDGKKIYGPWSNVRAYKLK